MAESPLRVQFPAEAAIQARPHHEFYIPFLPHSAHLRHLIAIGLAGTASFGLLATVLYPLLARHTIEQAVPIHIAQLVRSQPALRKSDRLATKQRFDGSRFAQVAEKTSNGETRIFTYHRTTLVFKAEDSDPSGGDAAAFNAAYDGDTQSEPALFSAPSLADIRPGIYPHANRYDAVRRSRFPVRGVPLNVSVSKATTGEAGREFKRLVSMPKDRQDLQDILASAGLDGNAGDELQRALETDTVSPGDSLELLLEKKTADAQPKLIMARLSGGKTPERIVARDDADSFVPLTDDRLFSTLYSESQADAPSSSEVAAVDLKSIDSDDRSTIRTKLEKAGLSDECADQLMKLAKANGVALTGDDTPDSVDLLFRKADNGKSELMFIEFHTDGDTHRFYLHKDGGIGPSEFYDEGGHSVAKVLTHRPVPNGTLGDGFAWRIHPILGVRKFHNGVDFRAPMGSPIMAAGDGTVEKISWETGYGKYVRIRHDGGYETTYAHIASTPSDLHVGERVTQGQVIAYVGSTGYSTGPHLYYELRVNGRYENPLTAQLPAGTNLTGKSLDSLRSQVSHVDNIMTYLDVPPPNEARPFSAFDQGPERGPGHFGRP
ncbi:MULTISPECIES: M23 family metallopeptidase [Rhizobium]|uniref:Murein DD-endopeptidase MepM/ murein hydrolase activator NlpD n=1 Tax=Rhizobium paranaense TaxID=1650438 RepID=A0A7W8XQT7_9HYPH|nr:MULTISPECIES: M23 family metallopeptidase [Rhizobium]MBB5573841.1 murein DD-endopeptidase MepM/ murein hydrolase activator NlpD [Rhizobium paranaense]PST61437.1 M23 family peptidase [Rhizobium sp. SEMIA4064]